ncbi:MAG: hypothetical protein GX316_01995 [Firmicutes bacterium]|nr:hypothetical protein [Bacillota bacterium]
MDNIPKVKTGGYLTEYRQYLTLKRTTLIEREKRRRGIESNDGRKSASALSFKKPCPAGSHPTSYKQPRLWLWTSLFVILFIPIVAGLSQLRFKHPSPVQHLGNTSEYGSDVPALVFWYQTGASEADILAALAAGYTKDNCAVEAINQRGDLPLLIQQAFIARQPPDVMLLSDELADQLLLVWEKAYSKQTASQHNQFHFPLWPEKPWRPKLSLVISPTTRYGPLAHDFASFLQDELSTSF